MVRPNLKTLFLINVYAVIVIAVLVLLGWHFDIEVLRHPIDGMVAMNPVTAITLILASMSLVFAASNNKPNYRSVAQILAILVLISGAVKLFNTLNGIETGFDTFLYTGKLKADVVNGFSNTMSVYSAVCFFLFGISSFFISKEKLRFVNIAHAGSLTLLFLSMLAIISYIYDTDSFYGDIAYIPMSLQTAICFFLLSVSILVMQDETGFMGEITSRYAGAKGARIILPVALIVPVLLGILRFKAEEGGFINSYYGTALFTVVTIIIFVLVIWKGASIVNDWNKSLMGQIEERRKTEDSIKETNIFLDTILENIPNMVFVKEAKDLRFIRVNRETERILGITREEFLGKNDSDFFPEEQASRFMEADRQVLSLGIAHEIAEEQITTYNGDRWLRTRKIPVFDKNKNPMYLIGISEDITSRKKDEEKIHNFYKDLENKVQQRTEELAKSEMRFRALIDNAMDVISMVDENCIIKFQSPPVEKVTGFPATEMTGKNCFSYFHYEDVHLMKGHFTNMIKKPGETFVFTTRMVHKDGRDVWIEGNMTNLLHDKNVNAMVLNYHDATERRLAEERLKKYYEEVKRSNKELEQFAYIASHDLQEPLRMVTSFLQLLEKRYESLFDETAKKYIHFATDGAERMKKLIIDLLAYSRVGAGKEVFVRVDLNQVLNELQETFKVEMDRLGAKLISDKLPVIRAIKTQMLQLFQNLISNALKYRGAEPPLIRISCSEEDRHWLFKIQDNGIGIEPRFFEKLFVLFQRLHDKKEYSGTGIGLAICKKIVEAHGGIIWVESEPGKGSTFIFMLKKA